MKISILSSSTVKDNIHALSGNISQALFGFLSFLLLTRHLNQQLFGQYVIFITAATLLDMLRLGLTGTAAIRLISSNAIDQRKNIIAASYQLSVISTVTVSILSFLIYFVCFNYIGSEAYLAVFLFYPFLSIANLPFHQASVVAQGDQKLNRVSVLKTINGASILLLTIVYLSVKDQYILKDLILIVITANAISSIIAMIKNWDGIAQIFDKVYDYRSRIMHFGKYATAGYIGSNLLKSSDTFILSMFPFMGPEAIAIYAIPVKFVELVEIPLRSFSSAAFPQLSASLKKKNGEFFKLLISYTLITSIILVPVIIGLLIFPDFALKLIGGSNYLDYISVQRVILFVFCVHILVLPFDRYTGVALFAMNKPKQNFIKIMLMLIANIIFDFLAVLIFQSLIYIAVATVLFTLLGSALGWLYIYRDKEIIISRKNLNLRVFLRTQLNGSTS
nr:oligosaccharide flippase family protein [uncultured Carboxylicivirga sp.]